MTSEKDLFKTAIQAFCKHNNIPPQKARVTKFDHFVTISLKNSLEQGLDMECFKILDFIFNVIGPTKTKFSQTTFVVPNSQKIDRIDISFDEKDYKMLIETLYH
ncbi:hypothetical protein [Rummeliibacillus suwonensis]|uniref:hypothetical protein n=1 Tax=Rummeliibacillus suwonensis TaxID=1306154 RepID=UPI001AAE2089|nr:hypothetical protein [Rummeliibacillus suwonensis]MBO2535560.1 hypothetical protein [Rummeliibacillus suwonensis]